MNTKGSWFNFKRLYNEILLKAGLGKASVLTNHEKAVNHDNTVWFTSSYVGNYRSLLISYCVRDVLQHVLDTFPVCVSLYEPLGITTNAKLVTWQAINGQFTSSHSYS